MRVIRFNEYRRMPWKNGGGETAEVVVCPAAAGLDSFDWRISMARVESSGPFSLFAGIDRTLIIIEGDGLRLKIAGCPPIDLTPTSEPFRFPADAATEAALIGTTTTDLNVMSRRGRIDHSVRRIMIGETTCLELDWPGLVLCQSGSPRIGGVGDTVELRPFDSLFFDGDAPARLQIEGSSVLLLVEIRREAPAD
jgi:environmental stress-induced protein Ves